MLKKADVLFLCGGKDFHAMDKFKLTADVIGLERVVLVTDTVEGEAQKSLIKSEYRVEFLLVIDRLTLGFQSPLTHLWRNILKAFLIPFQVTRLKRILCQYQVGTIHAITMYYMLLCYFARIRYVGTPQAGEIQERPYRLRIYKYFAGKAVTGADAIIVDSVAMKETIKNLWNRDAFVIKNGFDTALALRSQTCPDRRSKIISTRGFQKNYQILEILKARGKSFGKAPIEFAFPFHDTGYLKEVRSKLNPIDKLHGLLIKQELYELMGSAILSISIPTSDSSPRSVYESIFCGATVAMTYSGFYDELPICMRDRIYLVNTKNEKWFDEAVDFAQARAGSSYVPTPEALDMCDQYIAIHRVIQNVYDRF